MKYFCIISFFLYFASIEKGSASTFKVTSQIYMSFSYDDKPIGRVIIGMFGDVAPKTVKNFREICINGIEGMTYTGSGIHRIIDKFMIQGGDIVNGDGHGSVSIYGNFFDDENLEVNHTGPGFIAMANKGPNTNGCQFYITTTAAPWLDGKHTIFGKVIDGQGVVHTIEKLKTDTDDYPTKTVAITDCGDEPLSDVFTISDDPYDLWAWIRASSVPLGMSFSILAFFQWLLHKLDQILITQEQIEKSK